jgi:DNA replication protein DnaC
LSPRAHASSSGRKSGRGKTHLAVAIASRAIQNGFDTRFVTAAEPIDDLYADFCSRGFTEGLVSYVHPGVPVVDEVGYLTYGTDAANTFFHVNDRHRKRGAMILTTNKPLNAWGGCCTMTVWLTRSRPDN